MALLSHRMGWWLAGLISVFPCVFCSTSTDETPGITYHTSTSEVRIAFFATDENDRLIENVHASDFAIVDDGFVVRTFRSFSRADDTALDVVVVVDTSESVAQSFQQTIDTVRMLMRQSSLAPAVRLSVVTFAGLQSSFLCSTDCASRPAAGKLGQLKPDGATPLYDALVRVGIELSHGRNSDRRQILILFSDGNDTISRASARDALDQIVKIDAVIYGVRLSSLDTPSSTVTSLEQMAEVTGGRVLSLKHPDLLQTILSEQRASHVVTYEMPSRIRGYHRVLILPKQNLNLRFHCRRGYNYEEVRQ
jgi:VWFA-related protein